MICQFLREQIQRVNAQNLRSEIGAKTTPYFAARAPVETTVLKGLVASQIGMILATKKRAKQAAV